MTKISPSPSKSRRRAQGRGRRLEGPAANPAKLLLVAPRQPDRAVARTGTADSLVQLRLSLRRDAAGSRDADYGGFAVLVVRLGTVTWSLVVYVQNSALISKAFKT
jgi:hypothetical protein